MRDDMFEIIIERPRWGSRMGHFRRARRRDPKVDAKRDPEGMMRQIGIGRGSWMARGVKSLNENLAPLRRYLESQVNRPWDKVWSDISENLSTGSTVQQHVRDHIADLVFERVEQGLPRHGLVREHPRAPAGDSPPRAACGLGKQLAPDLLAGGERWQIFAPMLLARKGHHGRPAHAVADDEHRAELAEHALLLLPDHALDR